MHLLRIARRWVWFALFLVVVVIVWNRYRPAPQDLPWTDLDLVRPTGLFTGRKIAALADDAPRCRTLMSLAGARDRPESLASAHGCGQPDGLMIAARAARPAYSPARVVTSCPVDAGLLLWERDYVQPAALRHFGVPVRRIDHYGSYSCRPIYGRPGAAMSEHATANAIDVAGFRLADGRRITVAANWSGKGEESAFLQEVRAGACRLFATVLSPDYNAAHRDHLHLDQAARGATGWRACR